jgi:hypothetical protein
MQGKQPTTCTMPSQRHAQQVDNDMRNAQLRNPARDKSPKAVITANEQFIWWPILERAQRLSIGEKDATARGTKARVLTGGHSRGKENLTRGRSMAEDQSRGGANARMIKSERSWSTT